MKRSQHSGSFLVVEGRDDRLLCERFTSRKHCHVEVAEGKERVLDVLRILNADRFDGVCGIVDADFDRVEQTTVNTSNVFVPDGHDLDGMLVHSPALDAVLVEFGSREKIDAIGTPVIDLLISRANQIGCLRLQSRRSKANLTFDGMDYRAFLDPDSLAINLDALVQEVKNRSLRPELDSKKLVKELIGISKEGLNPLEICNGDDLIGTLSAGLRRALGTNDARTVRPEALRQALRLSYDSAQFDGCSLRRQMADWQGKSNVRLF